MNARNLPLGVCLSALCLVFSPPAFALANRVFVSQRSGNNANACDNILTPCQTLAGAVTQLNSNGEVIVLDSGGYGPVTLTQGVTIEAAAGVTAFIHPPSGIAVTINAPGATVTLRGLVLNTGTGTDVGVAVQAVGILNVENCFITGFNSGIFMGVGGRLNVKHTDVKSCVAGIYVSNSSGVAQITIDHCHLDDNSYGFLSQTIGSAYRSFTTATNSTADHNSLDGWRSGNFTDGIDQLHLEFCSASDNGNDGLSSFSDNINRISLSNCVFVQNGSYDIENAGFGAMYSRGNNTAPNLSVTLLPLASR